MSDCRFQAWVLDGGPAVREGVMGEGSVLAKDPEFTSGPSESQVPLSLAGGAQWAVNELEIHVCESLA